MALDEVVRAYRENAALRSKASLKLVTDVFGPSDWQSGPGDDAATVSVDGQKLLVAAEAMFPPFVLSDPFSAGVAAVITNINDVAAMGGRPLALLDTLVGTKEMAQRALEGMRYASTLYGLHIVGGHLTIREGPPSLSAFVLGCANEILSARRVSPGQVLLVACCLDGTMRTDFPFFSSSRERGRDVQGDVELLAIVAERRICMACKDISMAGMLGSLAMLLENTGAGVTVELERIPRPEGVDLLLWLAAFPSFGFLLCCHPDRVTECRRLFRERGLACEEIGVLNDSGVLNAQIGERMESLANLRVEPVTGLELKIK
jgi:selenophosphate synthetase-related protein